MNKLVKKEYILTSYFNKLLENDSRDYDISIDVDGFSIYLILRNNKNEKMSFSIYHLTDFDDKTFLETIEAMYNDSIKKED